MRLPQKIQHALGDINVTALVARANIVDSAWLAVFQDLQNRPAVIVNINPVTYVKAVAIDRNRFVAQRLRDRKRKKLFGKLVRSIVVSTACNYCIQSKGVMCRANQVFGASL